ncbi:hypothetical protein P4562_24065 [Lysinibacillus xylanilyticus]|uniref:hypothetical protein n=1 Tax=Lysinibacillus xylanilyticus TaxID=582475 RepID=UPI002E1ADEF3|nr:hypothetical protein [Lysinibacillus xylanilyticus]
MKDTSLIQWVGEGISNDSVRIVYESYYDTYNVTSENKESSNDAGSYDTSTIRGQKEKEKENKKEKQTTNSEVGQSLVTEEQLIFLTKFYDENIQRASGYICECIEHMTKENDPALVYEALFDLIASMNYFYDRGGNGGDGSNKNNSRPSSVGGFPGGGGTELSDDNHPNSIGSDGGNGYVQIHW